MQNIKNMGFAVIIVILLTLLCSFYGAWHDQKEENNKLRDSYAVCQNTVLQLKTLGEEQEKAIKSANQAASQETERSKIEIFELLNAKIPDRCEDAVMIGINEGIKLNAS